MPYPLILISSGRVTGARSILRQQSELYGACLTAAGALGVLYTRGDAALLAAKCDGLLLSGGGDLHPSLFGADCASTGTLSIDRIRDAEEQDLFHAFFRRNKPILGICRGLQAINVFLGGTLLLDMEGHDGVCHPISCDTELAALAGPHPMVNSYHHQAVDCPAAGLAVAARAPDGVIEALRHRAAPLLGVQWHPERMVPPVCSDAPPANHLPLFNWLVLHC